LKALFTGGPGTGKTLAAEVIAGLLGLPLLKVDLARVVSKWVGETEKNLDTVFREAEESHSVLFFDEADSLFGKRGEVQRGTDRYANLEVGFLLQRLEEYFGLVILASNLRDHMDAAFTRRFHVIVHFPAPRPLERGRIWRIAFPASAPLDPEIDFERLQTLDLTGAGIVSSARTAAMLASDEGSATIRMTHIVRAVARQFRREARILSPTSMGPYASLLQDTR
jgi:SpoVK/Ycf46/Vps4 family AAA+-type ATPase